LLFVIYTVINSISLPNSSPKEERNEVREEECVQHFFGKQAVLSHFGVANTVCFPLRMLEFPVPVGKYILSQ
jgi:hypothetical protein